VLVDAPAARHRLSPRRSGIGIGLAIQIELTKQSGEGDAAVTLDRDLRASTRLAEAILVNRPMLGDCLSCPLRSVPRLSGECQEPNMMLVKIEIAQHA
jgi:hypothetical protein